MRSTPIYAAGLGALLLACSAERNPTEPDLARTDDFEQPVAASNSWTAKAPRLAVGPLYQTFAGTAPNSAGQSIVYVFGGTDGEGTGFGTEAYNVSTDTWTREGNSIGIFAANGVAKLGNKLYFSGGYNDVEVTGSFSNLTWAYDYANKRLIQRAPLPLFGAEGVSGVISGKLYVLPGACSGERPDLPGYCEEEPTRRFFRYDPSTNSWTSRRQAPHVHRQGAAAVIGGKLYVAGGYDGFTPLGSLDVYDPATNQWTTRAALPQGGQAVGAALAGRFHVLVGTQHYAYDPSTNRWKALTPSQYGHDALLKVQLAGRAHLLAVGGYHGEFDEVPNPTELYTP